MNRAENEIRQRSADRAELDRILKETNAVVFEDDGITYIDTETTGLSGMTPEQWKWHNLKAKWDAIGEVLNGEVPELKQKYLVTLYTDDGRAAVVIDFTPKQAQQRAHMFDPGGGWLDSHVEIITMVRNTRIERVLAQEKRHV